MSVIGSNILAGASGQGGGYNLTKSLRFRSSASAYLNRTFGTPTLSTKWTWSGWLKFGYGSSYYTIFDGGSPDTRFGRDPSTNQLYVNNDTTNYIITTPVYRDYSAWYHAVLAFDSSQGTASNRLRLYINGSEVTAFATDNRSSISGAIGINTATAHGIGRQPSGGSAYFDGYMTEINFIDGQQLTPSSFGETSTSTGVWIPKKFTGTYGTNGFYLPFTNTTSTSTLGNDFSGNSNTWTVNNISLTSGSTYDSMNDVPTLTSATVANYAVLNPVATTSGSTYITNGNLYVTGSAGAIASIAYPSTGKYYFEVFISSGGNISIGIASSNLTGDGFYNQSTTTYMYAGSNGQLYTNGSAASYGASYTTNDVIGVAVDCGAGTLVFYKNNTSQGTAVSGLNFGNGFVAGIRVVSTAVAVANFGQRPFTYTPPTGFVALNTFNLPTPTIGATASSQANKYFDATTYSGNNGTQSVTNSNSMQPDFVWVKNRTNAYTHLLYDSVRGVGTLKAMSSSETTAEGGMSDNSTFGYLSALNSNGFTVVSGSTANSYTNSSSNNYIGWQWRASNAAGVTNTSGSITSTVSANTTAGFSIVTYTGNGTNGATVGHGLGVAPAFYIVKQRTASSATSWYCYHSSIDATPQNYAIYLNLTNAKDPSSLFWNNTAPTSSVFSLGTSTGVNGSSGTYVAYCFAQVAGYSAFGSYVGNGNADGPFIYTGFRPRYYILKNITNVQSWSVQDTSRSPYNVGSAVLLPNSSLAELTGTDFVDILSNGFKIRHSSSGNNNNNGDTYIYMAFAENPFKFSNAR